MGIQMASAYVGNTFMPPLFGRIASFAGFSILPLFIGGILLIKFLMIESLYKKLDRKKPL